MNNLISKGMDIKGTDFVSMVAHELKTPITTLKLLVQSHLTKTRTCDTHRIPSEDLSLVDRELSRLTRLVNDLLTLRKRQDKLDLDCSFERFDLSSFVSQLISEMKTYLRFKNLKLKQPTRPIFVLADADRIKQVLANLITNAHKHNIADKNILVSLETKPTEVIIAVADQGEGIPEDKQPFIFDKFYQAHQESEGCGLGLYISSEIVQIHQGKMWFKSKFGQGSTFFFSLPTRSC